MTVYMAVGLAGMIGALARYYIGEGVALLYDGAFPYATLGINLLGSFALAYVTSRVFERKRWSPELVAGVGTGLFGSFTTFSTFSVETITLAQHHMLLAAGYVFLSVSGGFTCAAIGFRLGAKEDGR